MSLEARFIEQATAMAATVDQIDTLDAVPEAITRLLQLEHLPLSVWRSPDPQLDAISWDDALDIFQASPTGDEKVSFTGCICGVAETGTLVVTSGAQTPLAFNFLPEIHIVLLRAESIVSTYEEAWQLIRKRGELPRSVNFITGPSRTGDIEQTIMLGIHGPRRLHILLCD